MLHLNEYIFNKNKYTVAVISYNYLRYDKKIQFTLKVKITKLQRGLQSQFDTAAAVMRKFKETKKKHDDKKITQKTSNAEVQSEKKQVRKLNLRRISKKRRLTKRSLRTLRSRKRKSPQSKSHKIKRPLKSPNRTQNLLKRKLRKRKRINIAKRWSK
ncbi:Hypothetical_protein [Hexamita inflata]|uniref:Hypothetical_protein n=1 Tax=Hexamita inflata TaxID=28002 RepID=A0AA86PWW0_9EUKA|nr:Hypothetical protein HINF_LOCUS30157 [Hexamita inflata]